MVSECFYRYIILFIEQKNNIFLVKINLK